VKRIAAVLTSAFVMAVLIGILTPVRLSSTAPGQQVEVFLHCGLRQAAVEFEGQIWKFVTDDPSPNPPWFAGDSQWVTFTIVRRGDEVLAYGPWFTVHRLVPPEEGDITGGCL
jgi:hypothetical protein